MSTPDPLLPFPDLDVEITSGLSGEQKVQALAAALYDHFNIHAIAWPARDEDGRFVPPPDEHVLHELAHSYELVDEERLFASPRLGVVGFVKDLPACDLCADKSRYDVLIKHNAQTAGAFLCERHYADLGSGTLGASGDSYLMRYSEVPDRVQQICNDLLEAQGRGPLSFETN
jgi:hypothetical protein